MGGFTNVTFNHANKLVVEFSRARAPPNQTCAAHTETNGETNA
jgi:hypothetical protein